MPQLPFDGAEDAGDNDLPSRPSEPLPGTVDHVPSVVGSDNAQPTGSYSGPPFIEAPNPASQAGERDNPGALPQIDGYEVLGELGRGGMGVVYRMRERELGRTLAVKVLHEKHCGDPELEIRFLDEAQLMGQLQHPGIPPVHQRGRLLDGRPFFSMKLVQGRTLAELLKERRNLIEDLPRLLGVFGQVCQTVAYVHSQGVIHRDLKPGNIMVGAFGEVQVMDWGLAKVLTDRRATPSVWPEEPSVICTLRMPNSGHSSQAGTVVGTPAYMAPEQARGEGERLDERCDVFSLGAILCQLLTGNPPYRGTGKGDIYRQAARGDLDDAVGRLDRSVEDKNLVQLARDCLSPKPEERPRNAARVAEAVAAWQTGQLEKRREYELDLAENRGRAKGEGRRRWLTLGLTVGVIMLLLALVGLAMWQRDKNHLEEMKAFESDIEANQRLAVAEVCKRQQRYSQAARLYKEAIALMRPSRRLTYDRYDAASAAALAAAEEGKDATVLNAEERGRWRSQALEWLWTDLIWYRKRLDGGRPESRKEVQDRLRHWQRDPGLSGLRDEAVLAHLPAKAREDCLQLWTEVEALLRVAKGDIQDK